MSPNALKRARHVISENLRTVAAAEALIRHDLTELGRLMAEAHRSYSQDFEASCVEADAMVELAQGLPGLIGARLTGGGFGGCTVNLVEAEHAPRFRANAGGTLCRENRHRPPDPYLSCIRGRTSGGCAHPISAVAGTLAGRNVDLAQIFFVLQESYELRGRRSRNFARRPYTFPSPVVQKLHFVGSASC